MDCLLDIGILVCIYFDFAASLCRRCILLSIQCIHYASIIDRVELLGLNIDQCFELTLAADVLHFFAGIWRANSIAWCRI